MIMQRFKPHSFAQHLNSCVFLDLHLCWMDPITAPECRWPSVVILIFVYCNFFTACSWCPFIICQQISAQVLITYPIIFSAEWVLTGSVKSSVYAPVFVDESSWCVISTNIKKNIIITMAYIAIAVGFPIDVPLVDLISLPPIMEISGERLKQFQTYLRMGVHIIPVLWRKVLLLIELNVLEATARRIASDSSLPMILYRASMID